MSEFTERLHLSSQVRDGLNPLNFIYVYYVGDLIKAVENNEEMAAGSGSTIQAGQAGNDRC